MRLSNRVLITLLTIFYSSLSFSFVAQAHEDPLEMPWPKGEKVPCRCDILAMPYELCLKGIGAEECFKVVKEEGKSKKKQCPNIKANGRELHWQDNVNDFATSSCAFKVSEEEEADPSVPGMSNPVIYPVVIPCHELGTWLENMQNDFQLYPFAQGNAVVRHGQTFEFAKPEMLMMVNHLNKNYAMLGVFPNGYACLLASGDGFEMLVKP